MNKDKLELYNRAKEEYYKGTPIMGDFEFDKLEAELGLENKSYVGTKHNPSYTVQHPFTLVIVNLLLRLNMMGVHLKCKQMNLVK